MQKYKISVSCKKAVIKKHLNRLIYRISLCLQKVKIDKEMILPIALFLQL